jgi:hypothetical protein
MLAPFHVCELFMDSLYFIVSLASVCDFRWTLGKVHFIGCLCSREQALGPLLVTVPTIAVVRKLFFRLSFACRLVRVKLATWQVSRMLLEY